MAAVANNPAFAKKAGIPQRVGADFLKADKGRKFAKGGDMAKKFPPFMGKETKAEEAKEMKVKAKSPAMYKKGEKAEGVHGKSGMEKPTKYAKGGGVEAKGKTNCKTVKMAYGGMTPTVGMAPNPQMATGPFVPKKAQMGGMTPAVGMAPRPKLGGTPMLQAGQQQRDQKMQQMLSAQQQLGVQQQNLAGQAQRRANNIQQASSSLGYTPQQTQFTAPGGMKKGGSVKTFAKGGGCELKGKTKGKFV